MIQLSIRLAFSRMNHLYFYWPTNCVVLVRQTCNWDTNAIRGNHYYYFLHSTEFSDSASSQPIPCTHIGHVLSSQRIFAWDRKLSTNTPPPSVRSEASARLFSFDFPAYGWIGKATGFGLMKCALMRNILIVSLTTTAPFAFSCLLMMRSLDKKNRTSSSMCSLIDVY